MSNSKGATGRNGFAVDGSFIVNGEWYAVTPQLAEDLASEPEAPTAQDRRNVVCWAIIHRIRKCSAYNHPARTGMERMVAAYVSDAVTDEDIAEAMRILVAVGGAIKVESE